MRKYPCLHNVSNSRSLLLTFTKYVKYISYAAKSLCMKSFDVEKVHFRVQASIFRLLVLIKWWNVLDTYLDCITCCSFWFFKLCFFFSIYIFLHHNPNYTLREGIVYHYRFLSSKEYRNKYRVINPGSQNLQYLT